MSKGLHIPSSVAISLRPDSSIRLNVKQFIFVVVACLTGAFSGGLAYATIQSHINSPDHVTTAHVLTLTKEIAALNSRLAVLEALQKGH